MSIEKITAKIISEAEASAQALLDQAQAEYDAIIKAAEEKAKVIEKDSQRIGLEDKEKIISRKKAVADIDGRKMLLETKQQSIANCFEAAMEKITSMEQDAYLDFLTAAVKNTGESDGQLILNEKDVASVGSKLVKRLKKELPGSSITLADETRDIKGGFLLQKEAVYINGTIEAMMQEAKETMIGDVAEILFQ